MMWLALPLFPLPMSTSPVEGQMASPTIFSRRLPFAYRSPMGLGARDVAGQWFADYFRPFAGLT
jgi:hypothetical protein